MSGLEQERHDGADDENRLEAFAQNDEETLQERFRAAARRPRRARRPSACSPRSRRAPARRRADRSPRIGALKSANSRSIDATTPGIARARRRLDRLEREVGVERAIAGVAHAGRCAPRSATARAATSMSRAAAAAEPLSLRAGAAASVALAHRQRAQIRDHALHLRRRELRRGGIGVPACPREPPRRSASRCAPPARRTIRQLGRQRAQRARRPRRRPSPSRRDSRRSPASTVLRPRRPAAARAAATPRYTTTFQRCSA